MRTAALFAALCLALLLASCTVTTPMPAPSPTTAPPAQTPSPTWTQAPSATRTPVPTAAPAPTATPTRPPSPTPTRAATLPPTRTRVPIPTPASSRPTPLSTQNSQNGLFDVVVLVDKRSPDIPRSDVVSVFEVSAAQLAARTGQWMRLVDVVYGLSRGTSGTEEQQMLDLALDYLRQNPTNPPEGILLFSDTETCRNAGGFSRVFKPPFAFQNEFKSPRPEIGGGNMYLAVVEFNHPYMQCGYGTPGGQIRQSDVSIGGECRNRNGLTCVQSGERWVCPNSLQDLYANRDYYVASIVSHEFLHPFGIAVSDLNMDHFASTECLKRGGATAAQYDALMADLWESQVNLGLCPDVFARFRR